MIRAGDRPCHGRDCIAAAKADGRRARNRQPMRRRALNARGCRVRSSVHFAAIIVAVIVGGVLPGATQQLPSGGGPVPELRRGANGELEAVPALRNSAPAPTRPKTSATGPPTAGSPVPRVADKVGRHYHGPSISVTPTVAHVGDTLTVSVVNTPNTKNKDWVQLQAIIGPTEAGASYTPFGLPDYSLRS